jgi:hypothetical protein
VISDELLKELVEVAEAVENDYSAYFVDWARLNSHSPDYDPAYKPEWPERVTRLRRTLRQVREEMLACEKKQLTSNPQMS